MFNSLLSKKPWLVIARKELKDALRDRNAIMTVLIFPLLGPLMVYFLLNQVINISTDVGDLSLSVSGYEYAPDLVDYLQQNGVDVKAFNDPAIEATAELGADAPVKIEQSRIDVVKKSIENRQFDYVLLIPADFQHRYAQSQSVNVEMHFDSSRTRAGAKRSRIEQIINGWSRETTTLRLLARGVSPQVINPIELVSIDVATQQVRAQRILNMVPFFTLLAAFVCGIGVAVESTAGERERKSLEPLLVNPISRTNIVIGKWLVAILFSASGLVLVTALMMVVLQKIPLAQVGLVFSLGNKEIIGIFASLLPIALFATSIQLFFGMLARSFKEAQGYISLISMLPMVPFFFTMFNDQAREMWMNFVPILGQFMLLTDVVGGKSPALIDFVVSAVAIFVVSFVFIYGTARLFKRERIIFS